MLRKIRGVLCGVVAVAATAAVPAMAQESTSISGNFDTLGTQITSGLQNPITIGLGIGAACFIVFFGWRLLRRATR